MMASYDILNPASASRARRRSEAACLPAGRHGGLVQGLDGPSCRSRKENAVSKKVNDLMMAFTKNAYEWFQVGK